MRKFLAPLLGAAALVSFAPAANAIDFVNTFTPGSTNFSVAGNIFSGPIVAGLQNSFTGAGTFQDTYQFTIPQTGTGSGSITTGTSQLLSITDLDIDSVFVNGVAAVKTFTDGGKTENFTISGVPITFGALNSIVVTGTSRGLGSYGGNATFIPAVPEPATWGMMILGFGLIGSAMRYSRRSTKVSFA